MGGLETLVSPVESGGLSVHVNLAAVEKLVSAMLDELGSVPADGDDELRAA